MELSQTCTEGWVNNEALDEARERLAEMGRTAVQDRHELNVVVGGAPQCRRRLVLGGLDTKLTSALQQLDWTPAFEDEASNACLKEVAKALLEAGVNVRHVSELRSKVRNQLKLVEGVAAGTNCWNFVQRRV